MLGGARKLGRGSGAPPAVRADQLDRADDDPKTLYGLVWRIVKAAIENDDNLKRVSILMTRIAVLIAAIAIVGAVFLVIKLAWLRSLPALLITHPTSMTCL